jgi:hypothetical protein
MVRLAKIKDDLSTATGQTIFKLQGITLEQTERPVINITPYKRLVDSFLSENKIIYKKVYDHGLWRIREFQGRAEGKPLELRQF